MRREKKKPPSDDEGSATIWMLGSLVAICAVCALWITVAEAGIARQRAEVAADLAAIAGAQASGSAESGPCQAAAAVALLNGARLQTCSVGADSIVSVRVAVSSPMVAHAFARAGSVVDQ